MSALMIILFSTLLLLRIANYVVIRMQKGATTRTFWIDAAFDIALFALLYQHGYFHSAVPA